MTGLLNLSRGIDTLNERIGKIVAWAIVVAILVSAINALIRRIFGVSSNAWLELQWYLFGAVFMLCASWTLKVNEHIRIDILSSRLSKRGRDYIDLLRPHLLPVSVRGPHALPVGALLRAILPVRRGLLERRRPPDLAGQGPDPAGVHPARDCSGSAN